MKEKKQKKKAECAKRLEILEKKFEILERNLTKNRYNKVSSLSFFGEYN